MSEEKSLRDIRLDKLQRLREIGQDPYRVEKFVSTRSAQQMLDRFESLQGERVSFAGRLVSYRLMGKAGFAHISDGDAKIQGYFKKDDLQEVEWEVFNLLDIGDHIGIEGEVFLTKTGEKSIHVRRLVPLSKSLQVLPLGKEKDGQSWYGLSDVEQRYRHRHLDLVCNPDARRVLVNRMRITSSVRRFMDSQGYLEAETPILQLEAGGAAARPFLTHFNAYEMDVKLRISLELYLKRLICGDIPKVYEIGRVFRNEGVSNRHNPEFTMIEFYEAYANLEDMMRTVEELFAFVAKDVFGSQRIIPPTEHGVVLQFDKPWARVHLLEAIEQHTGLRQDDLQDLDRAIARARELDVESKAQQAGGHIDLNKEDSLGGLIEKLLEVFIEPTLIQPSFVIGYPIETSPLAKKDPNNPGMTRRFEGYVLGREVCNAFSEINDPLDQRERFEAQLAAQARGADETHPMDEDFIFALEGGMPPTGGCGIGIDRLAMTLTGAEHIREVLLFPTMKPEHGTAECRNIVQRRSVSHMGRPWPTRKTMQPTLYATYDSLQRAQLALASLLRSGTPAEDLSLLFRNGESGPNGDPELLEDVVGIDAAPEDLSVLRGAEETEVSHVVEGRRGGGIGTATPDDSVSGVEEMDDGQAVAEDMIYPAKEGSFSSEEGADVETAADTGYFQTTRPGTRSMSDLPSEADLDAAESDLSPMHVPGFGYVVGSGALATAAATDSRDVSEQLRELGVPGDDAAKLAEAFRSGKAVVAVAVPMGGADAQSAEAMLGQYAPEILATFPEA